MIYEVKQNQRAVRNRVEATVICGKVDAVEVRDTVPLSEVGWDGRLRDDLPPLAIQPKVADGCPKAVPDCLSWLLAVLCQSLPIGVGLL